MGRGGFGKPILPDYVYESSLSFYKKLLPFLKTTHIYVGIAAIALVILHIALVGLPFDIQFFPVTGGFIPSNQVEMSRQSGRNRRSIDRVKLQAY